jgi:hypothetical protein
MRIERRSNPYSKENLLLDYFGWQSGKRMQMKPEYQSPADFVQTSTTPSNIWKKKN